MVPEMFGFTDNFEKGGGMIQLDLKVALLFFERCKKYHHHHWKVVVRIFKPSKYLSFVTIELKWLRKKSIQKNTKSPLSAAMKLAEFSVFPPEKHVCLQRRSAGREGRQSANHGGPELFLRMVYLPTFPIKINQM